MELIPDNMLPFVSASCAKAARQFARRVEPDGSEVFGEVYLEMSNLVSKDLTVLKDNARFCKIARARARWQFLKLFRDRP